MTGNQAPPDELLELLDRELLDEELLDDELVDEELDEELLDEELELLPELELDVLLDELDELPPDDELDEAVEDDELSTELLLDETGSGEVGPLVQPARPAATTAAGAPDSSSRKSLRLVRSSEGSELAGAPLSAMCPPAGGGAGRANAAELTIHGQSWGTGGATSDRWRRRVLAALLRESIARSGESHHPPR